MRYASKSYSLEELREIAAKHREEGRKIINEITKITSHFKKMEEYYSEWEDRLNDIQKAINEKSEETGIPPDKIEIKEYDILDDILGVQ